MKKLLVLTLLAAFIGLSTELLAQTTVMRPAVAFVKQDRRELYIKQLDTSAVQTFDLAALITATQALQVDSVRQLVVIGIDTVNQYLVLGGTFGYVDLQSNAHVAYQGIVSIPWPLSTITFSHFVNFLLPARMAANFRPEGVVEGNQWWVIERSYAAEGGDDSAVIYHGSTTGGSVDSTAGFFLEDGVQYSNLAVDAASHTALLMAIDAVASQDELTDDHTYMLFWTVGNPMQETDFTGSYTGVAKNIFYHQIDSMFGLTLIPRNDGGNVLMGLTSSMQQNNSINLISVQWSATNYNLNNNTYTIPRTCIPTSENFFSGQNCASAGYTECPIGARNGQYGNGGDMFVNSIGGDSVLFVTHESPDNCASRDSSSGIWYYNYVNGNGQAHLVYNDPDAQELQPVWIYMPYTIPAAPQYPGLAWQGTNSGSFGTVDTGKSSQLTFTAVDTSSVSTVIDSVKITGDTEFTTPNTFPVTVSSKLTQPFTVTFKPVAPSGTRNATLTVYFQGQNPSTLTQLLSGTSNVPLNNVAEDPALAASMSVQPNPFSTSATISLTSPESGGLSIVINDALGRAVYRSGVMESGAGQMQSFTFDAKSLGLPDGVYYVTAFIGDRQATREVIFAR